VIDEAFINDFTRKDVCMKTENFTLLLLMAHFPSHHFEIGEVVYRKGRKTRKEDSSDTACDSSAWIFDYGFWYCDLIEK
jgi:hypothetical protein